MKGFAKHHWPWNHFSTFLQKSPELLKIFKEVPQRLKIYKIHLDKLTIIKNTFKGVWNIWPYIDSLKTKIFYF